MFYIRGLLASTQTTFLLTQANGDLLSITTPSGKKYKIWITTQFFFFQACAFHNVLEMADILLFIQASMC